MAGLQSKRSYRDASLGRFDLLIYIKTDDMCISDLVYGARLISAWLHEKGMFGSIIESKPLRPTGFDFDILLGCRRHLFAHPTTSVPQDGHRYTPSGVAGEINLFPLVPCAQIFGICLEVRLTRWTPFFDWHITRCNSQG